MQTSRKRGRSYVIVARAERVNGSTGGKPLVVVGSLNVDTVLSVSRIPKGGETLIADNLAIFPGGKAPSPGHCRPAALELAGHKYSPCCRAPIKRQLLPNWPMRPL